MIGLQSLAIGTTPRTSSAIASFMRFDNDTARAVAIQVDGAHGAHGPPTFATDPDLSCYGVVGWPVRCE
jgi:hypothetical protein